MASGYGLRRAQWAESTFDGYDVDVLDVEALWVLVPRMVERCWGLSERVDDRWLDVLGTGVGAAFRTFCESLAVSDPGVIPVEELDVFREIVYGLEIGEGPTGVVTLAVFLTGGVEEELDARQICWLVLGQLLSRVEVGYRLGYEMARTGPAMEVWLNDLEHEWNVPEFYSPFLDALAAIVKRDVRLAISGDLDRSVGSEQVALDSAFLAELYEVMARVEFPATGPLPTPPWASAVPQLNDLFARAGWVRK